MVSGILQVKDLLVILAAAVQGGGADELVWIRVGDEIAPARAAGTALQGGENYSPMRWDFLVRDSPLPE